MNRACAIARFSARAVTCAAVALAGRVVAAILLAVVAATPVQAQVDVPPLAGRVGDNADLLPDASETALEAKLQQLEADTGAQVAVLTVERLDDEPIEDFSMRVAERWKLGQAGRDNGVLIVVAEQERQLRIEVGYGLEGALTDLRSKQIVADVMVPRFREGDFAGGIDAGVDAVAAAVRGEAMAEAGDTSGGGGFDALSGSRRAQGGGLSGLAVFIVILIIASILAIVIPGIRGWLAGLFLAPFHLVVWSEQFGLAGGVVMVVGWLILFVLMRLFVRLAQLAPDKRADSWRRGDRGGWSGGWPSGGFGGWSGGGSGGGFSGGGGSFGGGGASGGW